MTDTVFATVVSGTTVFVLGQAAVKLVIEPVQEMKRLIASISYDLIYEARLIAAPDVFTADQRAVVADRLRSYAAKLEQQLGLVPRYRFTACLFGLPTHDEVRLAAKTLILLSNVVPSLTEGEPDTSQLRLTTRR